MSPITPCIVTDLLPQTFEPSVLGLGATSHVYLTNTDTPAPVPFDWFQEHGHASLVSCSHEEQAGRYLTPMLVHGTDMVVLDRRYSASSGMRMKSKTQDQLMASLSRSAPDDERCKADALLWIEDDAHAPGHAPAPWKIGMRTADCLTWAFAGRLNPSAPTLAEPRGTRIFGLVHLGWRGLAAGLHWMVLAKVRDLLTDHATGACVQGPDASMREFFATARHYFSPAIFPSHYPCGLEDVGHHLLALPGPAAQVGPDAATHGLAPSMSATRRALCGFKTKECRPDIQLLTLLDLLCWGVPPETILVHRVNTAASPHYPSYRRDERGMQSSRTKRRLVTLIQRKPESTG